MSKINEISGVDGDYTTEGLLLGHLVMQTVDMTVSRENSAWRYRRSLIVKTIMVTHTMFIELWFT